jgi:hypothetical protein
MLATTTGSELTGHWTRMRRSLARFSGPVSLIHAPSFADSITTTLEFRFSVHTGPAPRRRGRADITNGKRGSGEPLRTDSHRFRTVQHNRAPLCQLACKQTRIRRFRRRLAPGVRQRPRWHRPGFALNISGAPLTCARTALLLAGSGHGLV